MALAHCQLATKVNTPKAAKEKLAGAIFASGLEHPLPSYGNDAEKIEEAHSENVKRRVTMRLISL